MRKKSSQCTKTPQSGYLEIDSYDSAELASRIRLSNRMIQAFAPVTFSATNYPFQVAQEEELVRYVECLKDGKALKWFGETYSEAEIELIQSVTDAATAICRERFKEIVQPSTSPLAATRLLRIVNRVSERLRRSVSVFEIGPGCGYFGAMVALQGHRYFGTDNAQAFYLWQNRLHRKLFEDAFVETAPVASDDVFGEKNIPKIAVSIHVPWWHFCCLYEKKPPQVDIVISNAVLGEVSDLALQYITRIARDMVFQGNVRLFVLDLWGAEFVNDRVNIGRAFEKVGWRQAYDKDFIGFVYGDFMSNLTGLDNELSPCGYSEENHLRRGEDFMRPRQSEIPKDYPFMQYLGYDIPVHYKG